MPIYCFRAECIGDVTRLQWAYVKKGKRLDVAMELDRNGAAEVQVTATVDEPIDHLRNAMYEVPDGEMMLETLHQRAPRKKAHGSSNVFSFRAECWHDVRAFRRRLFIAGVRVEMTIFPDARLLTDIEVELATDSDCYTMQRAMLEVDDGHVMLETLRACPLADNSLERNSDWLQGGFDNPDTPVACNSELEPDDLRSSGLTERSGLTTTAESTRLTIPLNRRGRADCTNDFA